MKGHRPFNVTVPLISQLEEKLALIPGWTPADQAYTLFNLVYLHSELDGDIVEVGSWCGQSAVALGHATRMLGKGTVHCIDLFPEKSDWYQNADGSYSFRVTAGGRTFDANTVHTVWKEPFERDILPVYQSYPGVLECFRETIARNRLSRVVKVHRGDVSTFVKSAKPGFKCKLVFFDADHGYEGLCRDIHLIEPFLIEGGWMCFDDAFTTATGVTRAVTDCILRNPRYAFCQQMTRKLFIARKVR